MVKVREGLEIFDNVEDFSRSIGSRAQIAASIVGAVFVVVVVAIVASLIFGLVAWLAPLIPSLVW